MLKPQEDELIINIEDANIEEEHKRTSFEHN